MAVNKFLTDIQVDGKIIVGSVPNNTGTLLTVSSVDGKTISTRTNAQIKTDLALGNVNDTSDVNKPISSATQTALNGKVAIGATQFIGTTSIANNRASATQTLTGVSIDGSSRRIQFIDGTRTLSDRLPNTLGRSVNFDFVNANVIGGTGNYGGVMTFSPWDGTTVSTGDSSYQLGFNNESGTNGSGIAGLKLRKGIDSTWGAWTTILSSANYNSYSPTLAGVGASGTWGINITGNAVNLSTTRSTWNTNGTMSAVVGQLAWKNYGNGHTIFDASGSLSPDGTAVNNSNATNVWTGTYPTLMGWNGTSTYGVRVDSARIADSASYATTAGSSSQVTINYSNNSNSTHQMLWGSGNSVYGSDLIYCNPSTDTIYSYALRGSGNLGGTGEAIYCPAGVYSNGTNWLYGNMIGNGGTISGYGDITATAFFTASDIRYKDIIKKQYQNIEELEVISYTWKDKTKGEKIQVGYSAQEVKKYIPDAVSEDENGFLSVNYIQVLVTKIESLEKRINQLENGI